MDKDIVVCHGLGDQEEYCHNGGQRYQKESELGHVLLVKNDQADLGHHKGSHKTEYFAGCHEIDPLPIGQVMVVGDQASQKDCREGKHGIVHGHADDEMRLVV